MIDKLKDKINDVEEHTITTRQVVVTFTFTDEDLADEDTKALYDVLVSSKGAIEQVEEEPESESTDTVQSYY